MWWCSKVLYSYLNIEIARLLKQLHQNTFYTLALVQHSLGTDFKSSNGVGIDRVFLEKRADCREGDRVDVFSVITEAHHCLAKADCVFASSNAIELFER